MMTLKEIQEKKARAQEMHAKNKKRFNRIFKAMCVTLGGFVGVVAGACMIALAPGPGALLTIGAISSFAGVGTAFGAYAVNMGLEVADSKARKELKREFPEIVGENTKLTERAYIHSGEVFRTLHKMEQHAQSPEGVMEEVEDIIARGKEREEEIKRVSEARKQNILKAMEEEAEK